jgi:hypothetical protein
MFCRRAAPKQNAAPRGGRELHEVNDRGGHISTSDVAHLNATSAALCARRQLATKF